MADSPNNRFMILHGLVEIASGLVTLLTFGFVHPDWTWRLAVMRARRQARRALEEADDG